MIELLLIRHGQSSNNAGPDASRVSDPGLTRLGQEQAERLAAWSGSWGITRLYCSPFLRSLQTTKPVSDATGLIPTVIPELCEQGGPYEGHDGTEKVGVEGLSRSAIASAYPGWELHETIRGNGWWGKAYETHAAAVKRAGRISQWFLSDLRAGTHALVIHADFKLRLLEVMFPLIADMQGQLGPLYNTGVTRVRIEESKFILHALNATLHLEPQMIT